jgi:general secretion pathway protein G
MKLRVRLISLSIILILALASGLLLLKYSLQKEREATLKLDLRTMREAIDNYTVDKQRAPQSLQDLISGHYLKQIPTDPLTRRKDWVPLFVDSILISPAQTASGIADIHSASTQIGRNGAAYCTW